MFNCDWVVICDLGGWEDSVCGGPEWQAEELSGENGEGEGSADRGHHRQWTEDTTTAQHLHRQTW